MKTLGTNKLPVFFPDATRAFVKSVDFSDLAGTFTPGVLVNTFHLYRELGEGVLSEFGGIKKFMSWDGDVISDSGGFQVMSLIKSGNLLGKITDEGVVVKQARGKSDVFSPEKSIRFQLKLKSDMVVVLDDFTPPKSDYGEAKKSVDRTIEWAKRSKSEFLRLTGIEKPLILGVVQGGKYQDLRKYCAEELIKIGFDGFGYGGWPLDDEGKFDLESAKTIAENSPDNYFLYGLGIGKPEDIVACVKLGYSVFDCVLPTRDARHGRLYVYNSDSMDEIDVYKDKFYSFYVPGAKDYEKNEPVSTACDCLLCKKYSKAYLSHLFKMRDFTAGRLATIHNLRFYSILMEKLKFALDPEMIRG